MKNIQISIKNKINLLKDSESNTIVLPKGEIILVDRIPSIYIYFFTSFTQLPHLLHPYSYTSSLIIIQFFYTELVQTS